jgi:hypothetical protein
LKNISSGGFQFGVSGSGSAVFDGIKQHHVPSSWVHSRSSGIRGFRLSISGWRRFSRLRFWVQGRAVFDSIKQHHVLVLGTWVLR